MNAGSIRQATCVAIGGRGILIEGPAGSGKSSLALMLIDRGASLVGDDGVVLSVRAGRLWAAPPPHTAGLIEIRGVGIARSATVEVAVSLCLRLTDEIPRFVENADVVELAGCAVPQLPFDARTPAAAVIAEHALRLHGLPAIGGSACT